MNPNDFASYLLKQGLATRTVRLYLQTARRIDLLCAELHYDVATLSPLEARELSDAWPGACSSRTQLRSTLQHLWDASGRLDGPGRAIRVPRRHEGLCRALAPAEAALLSDLARSRRDRKGLAVLLGLYGALRCAEIAAVRWADVDEEGWLRVIGKGDVERRFPLHEVLAEAWFGWCPAAVSPFLFPGRRNGTHCAPATIWAWVRELTGSLGLHVATHRLRHTALAEAHDRTGDLRAVMVFAGHKKPETTAIYTRTTGARLAAAVHSIDYSRSGR